jgi:hypothetical protein
VGKRHRRIRARSATGQVAGAANEKPGLNSPIVQNGLPNLRSPKKAPRPSQPNLSPPPDTTRALTEQFHAPTSGSAGRDVRSATEGAGFDGSRNARMTIGLIEPGHWGRSDDARGMRSRLEGTGSFGRDPSSNGASCPTSCELRKIVIASPCACLRHVGPADAVVGDRAVHAPGWFGGGVQGAASERLVRLRSP